MPFFKEKFSFLFKYKAWIISPDLAGNKAFAGKLAKVKNINFLKDIFNPRNCNIPLNFSESITVIVALKKIAVKRNIKLAFFTISSTSWRFIFENKMINIINVARYNKTDFIVFLLNIN